MVQIAMLGAGLACGLRCATARRALIVVAVIFAVVLAVQTPLVASDDGIATSTDLVIYSAIQLVSLAVGSAIALGLVARRSSRRG